MKEDIKNEERLENFQEIIESKNVLMDKEIYKKLSSREKNSRVDVGTYAGYKIMQYSCNNKSERISFIVIVTNANKVVFAERGTVFGDHYTVTDNVIQFDGFQFYDLFSDPKKKPLIVTKTISTPSTSINEEISIYYPNNNGELIKVLEIGLVRAYFHHIQKNENRMIFSLERIDSLSDGNTRKSKTVNFSWNKELRKFDIEGELKSKMNISINGFEKK